jgi:hypothetical protein
MTLDADDRLPRALAREPTSALEGNFHFERAETSATPD